MARRYSRDNRGRFAPAGSGATARGGRLKTAAGNKRATVTSKSGMVAQGRMTGAPLKGTIGKTSNARLNMGLTRPAKPGQRGAYNEARTQIRANKAAAKGARLGGTRKTTKAAAPKNTTPNKTGQSKTLNKFNSRPAGTKIINAKNQLVASSTRVPLKVQGKGANESDRAFARVATKSARSRAKAKPTPKLPREQRLARATATASRITNKRKQVADETGAAFAERRRISSRASSNARSSAFAKEEAAGKQSASALRSFQRAENRESNLRSALGRERQAARTGAPRPVSAAAKPSASKPDLSPSAFRRRAEVADVRARFAESAVQGLDRANPKNRRAFNRADSMRNAANSYSSILKRSQSSEFTTAQVFNSRPKKSTNPALSPSQKAAKTKAANKAKTLEKNIKAQEQARRYGR